MTIVLVAVVGLLLGWLTPQIGGWPLLRLADAVVWLGGFDQIARWGFAGFAIVVAAIEAFLAAAGLAPDVVLGEVPTRQVVVTAEHAAINAVMAGCRSEYMPVVVAAVRAGARGVGYAGAAPDPKGLSSI